MSPRKAKPSDPVTEVQVPLAASHIGDDSVPNVPKPSVPNPSVPKNDDFVVGSKWHQVRETNAYDGMCWIYSPARVEFLTEASAALVSVGQMLGLETDEVTRLEVFLQRSTRQLYFRPAGEKATDYFDVTETSNDYFSVNIRSLLQPRGLQIKTGHQSRFRVTLETDTPIGPALVVDLKKVEEHRKTARTKAKQAAKAAKAQGSLEEGAAATKTKTKAAAKAKKEASKATPEASAEASTQAEASPVSQQPSSQVKASQQAASQPQTSKPDATPESQGE